jgi:hypothetical protein
LLKKDVPYIYHVVLLKEKSVCTQLLSVEQETLQKLMIKMCHRCSVRERCSFLALCRFWYTCCFAKNSWYNSGFCFKRSLYKRFLKASLVTSLRIVLHLCLRPCLDGWPSAWPRPSMCTGKRQKPNMYAPTWVSPILLLKTL